MFTIDISNVNEVKNPVINSGIVIFDSTVNDYQSLIDGVLRGYEVALLDSNRDGIEQITEILSHYQGIGNIHIVAHGLPGSLSLGNSQLSLDTLESYQEQLKIWFSAVNTPGNNNQGSLLLYGCNVAAGDAGSEFVTKLHQLTGLEIAASSTPVGNQKLEGNWELDVRTHNQPVALAFAEATINSYQGILAQLDVKDIFKLNGYATQTSADTIRLTQDANNQSGTAMSKVRIDFDQAWTFDFNFYLGTRDVNGADGIGVVFHNDPNGSNALGQPGGGLGFQDILNGIGIELDTWNNAPSQNDIADDHTNIVRTSDMAALTSAQALPNLENGQLHRVVIQWNPVTDQLSYSIDGASKTPRVLSASMFGGSNLIYFGVSGSTGGSTNEHRFTINDFQGRLVDAQGNPYVPNKAPTLTGNATLSAINEDAANINGDTVSNLFSGKFSDSDPNSSLKGIAVVGNTANASSQGRWQYSSDGASWYDVGAVNDGTVALGLSAATKVRFLPVANYNGNPPGLNIRALDNSYSGSLTNGASKVNVNTSFNGGATAISAGTNIIATSITPTNDAPGVTNPIANTNATEDAPFSYQFAANAFSDIDAGDSLTYSAKLSGNQDLPSWLQFNAATRTFSGTPTNENVGTLGIKVTATDSSGATASSSFNVVIANVNDAPVVANLMGTQNVTEDAPFSIQIPANTFSDVDAGDSLTYSAKLANGSALPNWLQFNAATRTFSGTPGNENVGNLSIKVTATDKAGASANTNFDLAIANANDAPVASPIDNQNATEDAPFSFEVPADAFSDVDAGDSLTYTAQLSTGEDLPDWLSFDSTTRTFSGTPTNSSVGNLSIKVIATDIDGATADSTFDLAIANTNDAPTVDNLISLQNATEELAFEFELPTDTFSDLDVGDSLTYSATLIGGEALPAWLSFDPETMTFSGTPGNDDVGNIGINVVATDESGATANTDFAIAIANVNDAPVASPIDNQNATEDEPFSFKVPGNTFSDVDAGDSLTYTAQLSDGQKLPSWLSFDADTMTFRGTPTNSSVGDLSIKVIATDIDGATADSTFDLAIANTNDAPTVDNLISLQNATEELAFEFELPTDTFSDLDVGDSLTYSATLIGGEALPAWLSFDPETMTFSGTPGNDDVGNIGINVVATDESGATANTDFAIAVANVNDAPVVENLDKSGIDAKIVQFSLGDFTSHFTDIDNDNLTAIKITSLPTNGKLKLGNAEVRTNQEIEVSKLKDLYFAPDFKFKGNLSFDWNGFDGTAYAEENAKVNMTIDSGNHLPFVVIGKPMATEDSPFEYIVDSEFFDDQDIPDGDSLSYTATLQNGAPLPDWLSFDPETLALTGTPANDDVSNFRVKITATDTYGESTSGLLKVKVLNSNDAPTLAESIEDQTTTEDAPFSFSVPADTFADVDLGDSFTYTATLEDGSELPAWLSFDSDTLTFSGTPENSAVGNISVKVMATDTAGASISDTFNLEVVNINDAPVVGNEVVKQTAAEDESFSFTLPADTFIDVDSGDSLSYSATLEDGSGLPAWLSFDPETNTFSGTPGNDVVGTFAVKVTAVDQSGTMVSHTFDLEVANTNDAPVLNSAIADLTTDENASFTFAVPADTFADADLGDSLTYSVTLKDGSALPEWLSFDPETNTLNGTPANGDVGELEITVTATDDSGESISDDFNLEVVNVNDAPVVANPMPQVISTEEDAPLSLILPEDTFADVDAGDHLSYSASLEDGDALPEWLSFDSETMTFSANPTNDEVGDLDITVTATDDSEESVSNTFQLKVVNTNDAPILAKSIADQTINEDSLFDFTIDGDTFSDVDAGDSLSYVASLADGSDLPEWLTFDAENLTFSSVDAAPEGNYELKIMATDTSDASAEAVFNLNIDLTNVINGTSANEQFATTHKKDLISAEGGSDTITATLANLQQKDVIDGGSGTDTFNLTSGVATDNVEINLSDTANQLLSIADTTVSNFEKFDFANFAGTTDFQGSIKSDFILAGKGSDNLAGDAGNDVLTGNAGHDSLIGGAGNDTLTGNAGDDIITGGTGSDRFVFDINKAFSGSLMGSDQITDFAPTADKIVLDKSTFSSLTSIAGSGFSVASEFAVVNNDAALATSNALITYNSSSGALAYNQNGAADGFGTGDDQFALLENNPTLAATSFLIQA
jgi:Ca2+-binding RTX toxin-like protein